MSVPTLECLPTGMSASKSKSSNGAGSHSHPA